MKNIYRLISLFFVLGFGITSCDLDKYPYSDIEESQSLKTVKDAEISVGGLYAIMRENIYGLFTYSADIQTDLLHSTLDFGNRNGLVHKWTFTADDYSIRDTWYGYYNALANVNNFLVKAPNVVVESDADRQKMNVLIGETHFMRAYYYYNLVLRYAKDYEPASAATDLGVPLVLTYDFKAKPSRSSLKDVYAQIILDINAAKSALTSITGKSNAVRFNKDCVLALEARVKLTMHDFTGAKSAADELINSGVYPLVSTIADFKKMWHEDTSSEIIMHLFASQPSELGRAMDAYLGYNGTSKKYTPDFVPQKWTVDLYEDVDIRKSVYFEKKPVLIQGVDYTDIYLLNKYPGNKVLWTTANTNYQHMPILFRIAEMYLISAEAAAQSAATEAQALGTLNALRVKRGLVALNGLTGTALMNAIKDERTRELFCEGYRLDDLKRWKMGFTRGAAQNVNAINVGPDFSGKVVQAGDNKFVWGLPQNDMTTNPNLKGQQNPGW